MTLKIELVVIQVPFFCPVIECSECNATPCPFVREDKVAKAQAEYDEALHNLKAKEENLRAVILHD